MAQEHKRLLTVFNEEWLSEIERVSQSSYLPSKKNTTTRIKDQNAEKLGEKIPKKQAPFDGFSRPLHCGCPGSGTHAVTPVHLPRVTVIVSLSFPGAYGKLPLRHLEPNSPLPTPAPVPPSDLCAVLPAGRGHLSCCHLSCHLSLHPNTSLQRPHGRAPPLVLGPKFTQASGNHARVPGPPAFQPA